MQILPGDDDARREIGVGIDRHRPTIGRSKQSFRPRRGYRPVGGGVATQDERQVAAEQPRGGEHDGVEYRLHVGRRLTDDAQNLGCRGLPGQRLLRLLEQPRVLDGDDGLVGETLLERKLLRRKGQRPVAVYDENADRLPSRRNGVPAMTACARGARRRQAGPVGYFRIEIVECRECGSAGFRARPRRAEFRPPIGIFAAGTAERTRSAPAPTRNTCTHSPFLADEAKHWSTEQTRAGFGDLLQRLLGVARRAGNGAQDFGARGLAFPARAQLSLQPGILLARDRSPRPGKARSFNEIQHIRCPAAPGSKRRNRSLPDYSISAASGPAPSGQFFRRACLFPPMIERQAAGSPRSASARRSRRMMTPRARSSAAAAI